MRNSETYSEEEPDQIPTPNNCFEEAYTAPQLGFEATLHQEPPVITNNLYTIDEESAYCKFALKALG